MLAGAFVLFDAAVDVAVVPFGIGAVAGIAFIALSHLLSGSEEHEFGSGAPLFWPANAGQPASQPDAGRDGGSAALSLSGP